MQKVAARAAALIPTIAHEFDVERRLVPGLVKLALYDFVVLCDNSGSMYLEERLAALGDTLRRIAAIANRLEPEGIKVRFINHRNDHLFDALKCADDVDELTARMPVGGPTRIGQMLRDKIVEPMIMARAREGSLARPVIVVVITDGQVG